MNRWIRFLDEYVAYREDPQPQCAIEFTDGLSSSADVAFRKGRELSKKGEPRVEVMCRYPKNLALREALLAGFDWQRRYIHRHTKGYY